MKKQQIIIFILVGIMLFSVLATGLLLLIDNGESTNNTAQQLDELQQSECLPLAQDSSAQPIAAPEEPFVVEGKVQQLQVVDLVEGDGAVVETGACVTVHYQGSLAADGTIFDSSYERGQPIRLSLDQVIIGWQEGIPGMKVGGTRRLIIPSSMGYGETGSPPVIGPNADLVFVVEMLDVE